jgi:hypothetical protein
MKYLKMLGLAAIAAAALTAILGAGTASATKLCENNQTANCTSHVAEKSTLKFTAEDSVKLLGPFSIVIDTCTESTVEGPTTSTGGGEGVAVTGTVNTLTFGNCTRTTTVGKGGTLSIQHIAGTDNGTVTSSGAEVTVHNVPVGFESKTCIYATAETDLGTLTGLISGGKIAAPTFDISATINSTNGCPSGTWSGHYLYTGSTPFIVSTS